MSQFTPISLLPPLSKTLERLVVKKWITHNLQAIDDTQFAYLPQPGTERHVLRPICTLTSFVISTKHLVQSVCSVDFAKAVDKLPHAVILSAIINLQLPTEACVLD